MSPDRHKSEISFKVLGISPYSYRVKTLAFKNDKLLPVYSVNGLASRFPLLFFFFFSFVLFGPCSPIFSPSQNYWGGKCPPCPPPGTSLFDTEKTVENTTLPVGPESVWKHDQLDCYVLNWYTVHHAYISIEIYIFNMHQSKNWQSLSYSLYRRHYS